MKKRSKIGMYKAKSKHQINLKKLVDKTYGYNPKIPICFAKHYIPESTFGTYPDMINDVELKDNNINDHIRHFAKAETSTGMKMLAKDISNYFLCNKCEDVEDISKIIVRKDTLAFEFLCRSCKSKKSVKSINKRKKSDPVYGISLRYRQTLRTGFMLYIKSGKKNKKSEEILGISFADFYIYLINNSDFNKITTNTHLDHIIPISFARTEEEVYILNHYSNFQLLSKSDNSAKGNKYIRKNSLDRVIKNTPYKKQVLDIVKREDFYFI